MKDIQLWSESLKSVKVWVTEKSYNCAFAHCSCKNTLENFDRHVTDVVKVKIIFDSISVSLAYYGCLGISSSWMCGADCWPVSDSGTEYIITSDSSLESPRSLWWRVKIRADFGSAQNIQLLHGFFARTELVALAGVDSLVLVGRKRDRGKTRTSSVVVQDFCSLPVRAHLCRTCSSSVHWKLVSYRFLALVRWQCCPFFWGLFQKLRSEVFSKSSVKAGPELTENGLLSGSKRRKRSMAALRRISLANFCKMTVCHLSSSQTCKISSEKYPVLLLTFSLSVLKIWYH